MRTSFLVAVASTLMACSESSTIEVSDAATVVDAGSLTTTDAASTRPDASAPTTDATITSPPDAAPPALPQCELPAAPTGLPAITAQIAADDGAGTSVATGGDPTGVTRFDSVTLYVPAELSALVRTATVDADGTAWARIDGSTFELSSDVDVMIQRGMSMPMARMLKLAVAGEYAVAGSEIEITPSCLSAGDGELTTSERELYFSASAGRLTLYIVVHTFQGDVTIELAGPRSAS